MSKAGLDPGSDVTLVQQNDVGGAIEHYQRALAINPDNSNAQVNWGNALVRLNRLDEAIGHYEAALFIRPDNAEAHHNWGVALALQGKFAAAIEQFRATLAIEPNPWRRASIWRGDEAVAESRLVSKMIAPGTHTSCAPTARRIQK
jgi:tetratricopeptide (TPR) repeat protein